MAPRREREAPVGDQLGLQPRAEDRIRARAQVGEQLDRLLAAREVRQRVRQQPARLQPLRAEAGLGQRGAQMLDRGRLVRQRLRDAEFERDPRAAGGRRRLQQRPAQVADGGVRGAAGDGQPRRVEQPIARPPVADRLGGEHVAGDALGCPVVRVQQPRRMRVQQRALARGHPVEHRGRDDRVHEAQLAGISEHPLQPQRVSRARRCGEVCAGRRGSVGSRGAVLAGRRGCVEDGRVLAGGHGYVACAGRRRRVLAGQRGGVAQRGRFAEDGRGAGELAAAGAVDADGDGARDAGRRRRFAAPQRLLAREERVAAGRRVTGGDDRLVDLAGQLRDQFADGVEAERARRERDRGGRREQPAQQPVVLGQRRAHGDDEQHGEPVEARGEEVEEAQRLGVGPLRVVDHQRQRPGLGQSRDRQRERLERGERRLVGGHVRGGWESDAGGCEQLVGEAERQRLLQLAAASAQHLRASRARRRGGGCQQRALADPRRPLDRDDARPPLGQPRHGSRDRADLVGALQQQQLGSSRRGHTHEAR